MGLEYPTSSIFEWFIVVQFKSRTLLACNLKKYIERLYDLTDLRHDPSVFLINRLREAELKMS